MTQGYSTRRDHDLAAEDAVRLGGRLDLLAPQELTEAQRQIYDLISSEHMPKAEKSGYVGQLPDGRVIGLYNVLLYSPELTMGLGAWMDGLSRSNLADEVREVVILAVGAMWRSEYQLYAHAAIARQIGLSDKMIDAIKEEREPDGISADAVVAYRFTCSLLSQRRVDDDLYAQAVAAFTIPGIAALVHLIGLYQTVSALLNCFQVPAPSN
ncbi:carboxymuconolactone decarboxylase family protein [Kribbella deserti]|uniref:Carboxymuconolactone decarboxylase family protein n=1 Tax=Kribbella deserti TaxID=1926257 RepID=A0ABV6QZC0_9ACTN